MSQTYAGLYRGTVTSVDRATLKVKCRVPSVTGMAVVEAEACVPPGWHDKDRDLLQDHPNHGAHADPDGTLAHSPNHGTQNPHRLTSVVPRPGIEGVWIMYEEGDHEHPVWIGTFKIGAK